MVDLAFSKRGGDRCGGRGGAWSIDEEELDLLVEEYALPLEPQSQWDDLVEESNRYFKRQYKEVQLRKRDEDTAASIACQHFNLNHGASTSASRQSIPSRIASLFDMTAAVVAAYFTSELRDCLPDDVLTAVQRHMTKERQIECLHEYKRWADDGGHPGAATTTTASKTKTLVKYCPYDAQGRKHGQALEWRPSSGALWRSTRFEFGLRAGDYVEYFADGTTKALEVQYRDERVHGHVKWWYESGRLAGQQTFVHGLKHGAGHVWREDGSLWRSKNYRDDRKHGICRTFDEAGRVVKSSRYDGGRKRKAGAAELTTSCPGVNAAAVVPASWEPSLIGRV